MRSFFPLSVVFLAVTASSANQWTRRALSQATLLDYAENIIFVQDPIEGLFTEINVGETGNTVLTLLDFQRCASKTVPVSSRRSHTTGSADLFVGGPVTGAGAFAASSARVHLDYTFFSDPVSSTMILQFHFITSSTILQMTVRFSQLMYRSEARRYLNRLVRDNSFSACRRLIVKLNSVQRNKSIHGSEQSVPGIQTFCGAWSGHYRTISCCWGCQRTRQ
jgi:hypothetical protein